MTTSDCVITGGAGFIGSHLCEALLEEGNHTTCLDNLVSGSTTNLSSIGNSADFRFVKGDCKSPRVLRSVLTDADTVFHFAANPEVRLDRVDPAVTFRENVVATQKVLEAASNSAVKTVVFASSSTVYGEVSVLPTPEDYSPLSPISIYGASKLASEVLLGAYAKTYGFKGVILRFANIIGPRSNHGVIPDFIRKLRVDPKVLDILGDGTQAKSYLHISDCVSAILRAAESPSGVDVFNVGSEDQVDVTSVARLVASRMHLRPRLEPGGGVEGGRGWAGDVKTMLLDVSRLRAKGWKPRYSSRYAIELTTRQIVGSTARKSREDRSCVHHTFKGQ